MKRPLQFAALCLESPQHLHALNAGEPCGRAVIVKARFDAVGMEHCDLPVIARSESSSQICFRDRMRAGLGCGVTEAEKVERSAGLGNAREAGGVFGALLGVKGMEEPAINDGSKEAPEPVEMKGIAKNKVHPQAASGSFVARDRKRGRSDINAHDLETERGQQERVLARAAAGIEHRAGEFSFGGEAREGLLRVPDVPRRGTVMIRGVPGNAGRLFVAGRVARQVIRRFVHRGMKLSRPIVAQKKCGQLVHWPLECCLRCSCLSASLRLSLRRAEVKE